MLVKILILTLLTLTASAQSGRYKINTVDSHRTDSGYVTINNYFIRIENDSVQNLPVTDIGEDYDRSYYILSGCSGGREFRGAAIFYASSSRSIGGGHRRYYFLLYIEIRGRQHYSATRYSIYYDE